MIKQFIVVFILVVFTFTNKVPALSTSCGTVHDWSSFGVPGFQGNCYLVTNAQIRWMQQNGYISNINTAPNNNNCPTKQEIINYTNSGFCIESGWNSLSSNQAVPIGYIVYCV